MAALAGIPDKILKETEEIQKIINDIKNSGTYLIYSNKKSVISKIEDIQKEIDAYSIRKILKADFVSKTKDNLNECKELILSYNQNFIQQRKKGSRLRIIIAVKIACHNHYVRKRSKSSLLNEVP
jgi:hypothetical protein